MNRYLYDLAIEILKLYPGQSKVKFAKLIYFVHKELVRSDLVPSNELSFVRMPLGPVPNGFMGLENQQGIQVSLVATQLMYNSQIYNFDGVYQTELSDSVKKNISLTLKSLSLLSTTAIVELAHQEYSWINLPNGKEYMIDNHDLETTIPKNIKASEENELGLQEKLVSGMLSDIVASSTSLEYPEDER